MKLEKSKSKKIKEHDVDRPNNLSITISVISFVASFIWLLRDKDFEPFLAFVASFGILITILSKSKHYLKFIISIVLLCVGALFLCRMIQEDDKFFSENDGNFKILIIPFRELCKVGDKNYDAGVVLKNRLNQISTDEELEIKSIYWNTYDFDSKYSLEEQRKYHNADMIIFGSYFTSDCSSEGDKICLNYMIDRNWGLGELSANLKNDYIPGGFDELRKGLIQESIENLATIISILGKIKDVNKPKFRARTEEVINSGELDYSVKPKLYLELAHEYYADGEIPAALNYYKKTFEEALGISQFYEYGLAAKWIGWIHYMNGDYGVAISFFKKYNTALEKAFYENPNNADYKYELGISYWTQSWMYWPCESCKFIEDNLNNQYDIDLLNAIKYNRIFTELYESFSENGSYKKELAMSLYMMNYIRSNLNHPVDAKELKKAEELVLDLLDEDGNNFEYRYLKEDLHELMKNNNIKIIDYTLETMIIIFGISIIIVFGFFKLNGGSLKG